MKRRTTEVATVHKYLAYLQRKRRFTQLEGLLIKGTVEQLKNEVETGVRSEANFTGVEAVVLDPGERPEDALTRLEPRPQAGERIEARYNVNNWLLRIRFCELLDAPLYLITTELSGTQFLVHRVTEEDRLPKLTHEATLGPEGFSDWWAAHKTYAQRKALVEASERAYVTPFDKVIEKAGLAWGGNIDGFTFNHDGALKHVIEVRNTKRRPIQAYDPAEFFSGTADRGGDYNNWLPNLAIAKRLRVPLELFTFSHFVETEEAKGRRLASSNSAPPAEAGYARVTGVTLSTLTYLEGKRPSETVFWNLDQFLKHYDSLVEGKANRN